MAVEPGRYEEMEEEERKEGGCSEEVHREAGAVCGRFKSFGVCFVIERTGLRCLHPVF